MPPQPNPEFKDCFIVDENPLPGVRPFLPSLYWNYFSSSTKILQQKKIVQVKCRFCSFTKARNPKRMKEHMLNCSGYQRFKHRRVRIAAVIGNSQSDQNTSIPHNPSQQLQQEAANAVSETCATPNINTWTANLTEAASTTYGRDPSYPKYVEVDSSVQFEVSTQAAMAVYMGARPFTMLRERYMAAFIHSIAFFNFLIPNAEDLAGSLLLFCYKAVRAAVYLVLGQFSCLNFIVDESTDITGRRLINLSVNTPVGAFYIRSVDVGSLTENAGNLASWIRTAIEEVVGAAGWWKVNSLTTDTCSVMRAVWNIFESDPLTKHIFCIPCDAHGLQLLMGDILKLPGNAILIEKAQTIARFFRHAKKQYALLRTHQYKRWQKHIAFILSVLTRWGTQAALIKAVIANKEPLRDILSDKEAQIPADVGNIIKDTSFWACLDDIQCLVNGISEQIKMSESDRTHVGHVRKRWELIEQHLEKCSELGTFRVPGRQIEASQFVRTCQERRKTQLRSIHLVAYYLLPETVLQKISPTEEELATIISFFETYAHPVDIETIRLEFANFRSRFYPFSSSSKTWDLASKPLAFWKEMTISSPELGHLAIRVFSTPACSVPSERAFSIRNLIQDKKRNSLSDISADMLTFIHINQRVLDRQINPEQLHSWIELSLEELSHYELDYLYEPIGEPDWFESR
jgi:hypothetical protein